jgi:hypothetical protein
VLSRPVSIGSGPPSTIIFPSRYPRGGAGVATSDKAAPSSVTVAADEASTPTRTEAAPSPSARRR